MSIVASESLEVCWPPRVNLFGVQISPTNYAEVTEKVIEAAQLRHSAIVSCHAVHALVESSRDPELRERVNGFDVITPDGQPVRWALNLLYGTGLQDRVYGPRLTFELCQAAADEDVSIYLYGGSPTAVEQMAQNLTARIPNLQIAGYESPPFRPLTDEEDEAVVQRINSSGAGIVFIGLGFPKQDLFAADHQGRLLGVQVCVGAAFDFHAGAKRTAPAWMQRSGLEWAFRLCEEPKRLWKRYLVTNSIYVWKLALSLPHLWRMRRTYASLSGSHDSWDTKKQPVTQS